MPLVGHLVREMLARELHELVAHRLKPAQRTPAIGGVGEAERHRRAHGSPHCEQDLSLEIHRRSSE